MEATYRVKVCGAMGSTTRMLFRVVSNGSATEYCPIKVVSIVMVWLGTCTTAPVHADMTSIFMLLDVKVTESPVHTTRLESIGCNRLPLRDCTMGVQDICELYWACHPCISIDTTVELLFQVTFITPVGLVRAAGGLLEQYPLRGAASCVTIPLQEASEHEYTVTVSADIVQKAVKLRVVVLAPGGAMIHT